MNHDVSTKFALGVLVPFITIVAGLLVFREEVQDWWYFQNYEPSYAIEKLSDLSGMSDEGEKLFFRTDPELVSLSKINEDCHEQQVLGCLVTGPKIFVLDYTKGDSQERDQAVVTAAHEMLHMAYFRLTNKEKEVIQPFIDSVLEHPENGWLVRYLSGLDGEEYYDEAHSMIGTEVQDIGDELEGHFSQYFSERDKVLSAYQNSKFVSGGA
jgi:hypothetical protein